jgi:glycosyltransferase involved in cell wall biosynthesis
LFLITEDWFFLSHFIDRAKAAQAAGYEVVVGARTGEQAARIAERGLRVEHIAFDRSRANPFAELRTLAEIVRLYRRERPDIVHHVALKPVIYGSLAARLLGIRAVVNAPVGMGYVFASVGLRARFLRPLVSMALGRLLNLRGSKVVFENGDDLRSMLAKGVVRAADATVIRGAGVDIEQFHPVERPDRVPTVILVARMLWEKGLGDYVRAAEMLKREGVGARFVLVGAPDPHNPSSVDEAQLRAWNEQGAVEWLGARRDIPELLAAADIACLPSYYREGLPKALLEALASGLPLVTTDVVGCREAVSHEVNGLLVKPRDPEALANALRRLIEDKALRDAMGAAGRARAVAEFSTTLVNDQTLGLYKGLLP